MAKRYEERYGRGGYRRDREHAHDRGYVDRAGDEVRSWFGDEDAQRRRTMDEYREREHEPRRTSESNRTDWNRGDWDRSGWNRSDASRSDWNRSDWNRRPENWRGASENQPTRYQDYGTTRSSNWDEERWRNRDYDEMGRYSDSDRYSTREYRPASNWSVDEGRTQFGQRHWGRGPKGYQRSDNRILEDVCDRLMYSEVDAGDIEVRVENGEVTLSGAVHDRWDKRRAEDVAEEVSGVRDVHNNIRVQHAERGLGQSDTSASEQPGTVLGVNPTEGSNITNARPKAKL